MRPSSTPNSNSGAIPASGFLMPAWMVRAFATGAGPVAEDIALSLDPWRESGLLPQLTQDQLVSLSGILGDLQLQAMSKKWDGVCRVGLDDVRMHFSKSGAHAGASAAALLQHLTSLRLFETKLTNNVETSSSGANESLTSRTWSFFQDVEWGSKTIALRGSDGIEEALFGLVNPYLDAVRFGNSATEMRTILGTETPLYLWKSLWFDLSVSEASLLLNLERAVEWDARWLRLEGTFGVPIGGLFAGVPMARLSGHQTPFVRNLQALSKLGKKLSEHGYLAGSLTEGPIAVDSGQMDIQLVWQLTEDRLAGTTASQYRGAVLNVLWHQQLKRLPDVERILGINLPYSEKSFVSNLMAAMPIEDRAAQLLNCCIDLAPNQMIFLPILAMEWLGRCQPSARFPLPDAVRSSRWFGLIKSAVSAGASTSDPAALLAGMQEPGLRRLLTEVPLASLVSAVSRALPDVATYLRSRLSKSTAEAAPKMEPLGFAGAAVLDRPAERAPVEATVVSKQASAAADQLRRVALEELRKMRQSAPQSYVELKKSYFVSLEETPRRLLEDVERRMQPRIFDEHITQRLVRFMIENPGAWTSVGRDAPPLASMPRESARFVGRPEGATFQ